MYTFIKAIEQTLRQLSMPHSLRMRLARFEEEDVDLSHVEIDHVLGLMCQVTVKVCLTRFEEEDSDLS